MTDTIETHPTAPEATQWDVLIPVRDLIDKHPDLALAIRETVTQYVRDAEYPSLIPVQITRDGETYPGTRCPWCGADVENRAAFEAVDENDRPTEASAGDFDHDRRTVHFEYSGSGQFDPLCYRCAVCSRPVSLPDGWTEN